LVCIVRVELDLLWDHVFVFLVAQSLGRQIELICSLPLEIVDVLATIDEHHTVLIFSEDLSVKCVPVCLDCVLEVELIDRQVISFLREGLGLLLFKGLLKLYLIHPLSDALLFKWETLWVGS